VAQAMGEQTPFIAHGVERYAAYQSRSFIFFVVFGGFLHVPRHPVAEWVVRRAFCV
jgi:hypothetical protein